jgi:BirA family biotin operon repressor/biotin-[acetyl-CoA-carboxylase] ligase
MDQRLTATILRFDSLPSTNTEAARQAMRGAPEGVCVTARAQTAGRGRQDRRWFSPPDAGLYFSIILRPRFEARRWSLITLMAAIAVHDALLEACALPTDIKWPNDIEAQGRKLCGILAETVDAPGGRAVIVGIGINLKDSAFPPDLSERAASIEGVTGRAPDAEAVLGALIKALSARYAALHAADGAEQTRRAWIDRSSYAAGKRVRVTLDRRVISGTTRGLESDGALRVETDQGTIEIVRAGEVNALRKDEA